LELVIDDRPRVVADPGPAAEQAIEDVQILGGRASVPGPSRSSNPPARSIVAWRTAKLPPVPTRHGSERPAKVRALVAVR
jgi:hypothetical protein